MSLTPSPSLPSSLLLCLYHPYTFVSNILSLCLSETMFDVSCPLFFLFHSLCLFIPPLSLSLPPFVTLFVLPSLPCSLPLSLPSSTNFSVPLGHPHSHVFLCSLGLSLQLTLPLTSSLHTPFLPPSLLHHLPKFCPTFLPYSFSVSPLFITPSLFFLPRPPIPTPFLSLSHCSLSRYISNLFLWCEKQREYGRRASGIKRGVSALILYNRC